MQRQCIAGGGLGGHARADQSLLRRYLKKPDPSNRSGDGRSQIGSSRNQQRYRQQDPQGSKVLLKVERIGKDQVHRTFNQPHRQGAQE